MLQGVRDEIIIAANKGSDEFFQLAI